MDGKPWPRIRVYQLVKAAPEQVCAVFFDYENAKSFVPNVLSSEISKKISSCSFEVDYAVSVPLLPDEKYTARNKLTPEDGGSYKVEWQLVRAIQTKESKGNLRMQPYEGKTVICYDNYVVPNLPMAGMLKGPAIGQMKGTVQAIVDQVEKQKQSNPSGLAKQVEELRTAIGQQK